MLDLLFKLGELVRFMAVAEEKIKYLGEKHDRLESDLLETLRTLRDVELKLAKQEQALESLQSVLESAARGARDTKRELGELKTKVAVLEHDLKTAEDRIMLRILEKYISRGGARPPELPGD